MRRRLFLALATAAFPACASAQAIATREGYILAHDHGWVELAILDDAFPVYTAIDEPGGVQPCRTRFASS